MTSENLPQKLYKYRGTDDYVKESLKNNTIYFASGSELNDKIDSKPVIDIKNDNFLHFKNACLKIIGVTKNGMEDAVASIFDDYGKVEPERQKRLDYLLNKMKGFFNKEIHNLTEKYGICSLAAIESDSWKNSGEMWSGFANKHKGICIEYDTRELKIPIEKITYENTRTIPASLLSEMASDSDPRDRTIIREMIRYSFLIKTPEYEAEHEWRIVSSDKGSSDKGSYSDHGLVITGIYFGIDCDKKYIIEIMQIFKNRPEVAFYKMVQNDDGLLEPRRITEEERIEAIADPKGC